MNEESRQQTRARLFDENFRRYDGGKESHKGLGSRRDRCKMARAYAAGAWRGIQRGESRA